MINEKFCWGVIGCGNIAARFTESLKVVPDAIVYGVASKSVQRARDFAEKNKVKTWFDSYEELVSKPEIDAIYIATTHNFHYENIKLCLKAGKAVLCEKPLTVNARQADEIIKLARTEKVFLMEAFWTRFLPSTRKLMELLDKNVIGEVKMIKADFGYDFPFDAKSRVYDPELAGGALLDVGVYPINFAQMIMKKDPVDIQSSVIFSSTGIDEQSGYVFHYENGVMALLYSAVNVETRHDAWIFGSKGYIHIPHFYRANKFHINYKKGGSKTYDLPLASEGFSYEAEEVINCMKNNKTESDIMPHEESLRIMNIMDGIRRSWGLRYPADQ